MLNKSHVHVISWVIQIMQGMVQALWLEKWFPLAVLVEGMRVDVSPNFVGFPLDGPRC